MPLSFEVRYEQICADIRFTDNVSLKLLGFVPLVTGAGIFTVLFAGPGRDAREAAILGGFVGLLGAIVTFAIYRWEVRNLEFCKHLRQQVEHLESKGKFKEEHGTSVIVSWLALPGLAALLA